MYAMASSLYHLSVFTRMIYKFLNAFKTFPLISFCCFIFICLINFILTSRGRLSDHYLAFGHMLNTCISYDDIHM